MQIVSTFDELAAALGTRRSALTIGVFDGVHLGHQALISKAVSIAREHDEVPVAVTFRHHPLSVLAPPYTPRRLLTPERKGQLLAAMGIELVVMLKFTREFANTPPETFISENLVRKASVGHMVCGYDFTFGCQGSGDFELLESAGKAAGFSALSVPAISHENHPVKSTHIRDLLFGGHVSQATTLLTRPHEVPGVVGSGMKRGRTIGFPTANLMVADNYQLPAGGVYLGAARVNTNDTVLPAMINIGTNPTFGGNAQTVEANILDFDSDIHGQPLSLFFIERLRDERKFPDVAALVEQLHKDREQTRSLWASDAIDSIVKKIPAPVDHCLAG